MRATNFVEEQKYFPNTVDSRYLDVDFEDIFFVYKNSYYKMHLILLRQSDSISFCGYDQFFNIITVNNNVNTL